MKSRLFSTLCLTALLAGGAWADDTVAVFNDPAVMPTPTPTPVPIYAAKDQDLPANAMWLDKFNLSLVTTKLGTPRGGMSAWGQPMKLNGITYLHGVGLPGESEMTIDLRGNAISLEGLVGLDDEVRKMGDVSFAAIVDGRTAFDSGEMHGGDAPKEVKVDLTGAKTLVLRVTELGGSDYGNNSDWAGAFIRVKPNTRMMPSMRALPQKAVYPVVLPAPVVPVISGPAIVGASPNKAFMYRVPASGAGTLAYACSGLPAGLKIDAKTGIITGQVATAGTYPVRVSVSNAKGKAEKTLAIKCTPNALALTPPMAWSAYERFGEANSDAKVREGAQWLVKSGLAAHGYRTVLVGDGWQDQRDAKGVLHSNKRFPNMKALGDYLHSLGLQFGINSAATEHTSTGAPGSAGHETQDAQMFADWGVDYLTYEWAPSANDVKPVPKLEDEDNSQAAMEAGFGGMRQALSKTRRDIVLSISVPALEFPDENNRIIYVRLNVAAMAKKVGAQVWTERNGLYDNWKVMSSFFNSQMMSMVPYHAAPVPPRLPVQPVAQSVAPKPVIIGPRLPLLSPAQTTVVTTAPAGTTVVVGTVVAGGEAPGTATAPVATSDATKTTETVVIGKVVPNADGSFSVGIGGNATALATGTAPATSPATGTAPAATGTVVVGTAVTRPDGSVGIAIGGTALAGGAPTPKVGVVIPDKPAPGTGAAGVAALNTLRSALAGVVNSTASTPLAGTTGATPVVPKIKPPVPTPDPAPGFWPYASSIMSGRIGYPVAHLSHLTPGEQMYQMSLWSLFSMPLILNSDLARLDPNLMAPTTTAVLTNDEVLDIDQDSLASPPMMVSGVWQTLIRTKLLSDGRVAVGLFNGTDMPRNMRIPWTALSMTSAQPVRDVWAHKDLGEFKDTFETLVPAHGVVLVKIGRPKTEVAH